MTRRGQQGAALILMATVLVLGVAWFAVGVLKSRPITDYQREAKTGAALRDAKTAVLAYVSQYAARSTTNEPGQMPCPESLNYYAAGTEGQASTSCSNATETVGRLPWRTLGIDQLRDGYGEPLWFVLSRGFRTAPINFGTPGQITYNGGANAAVALIIAPGRVANTLSDPGTPPAACSKVNEASTNRNSTASPLDPTKFLECGNATGAYGNPGNMTNWSSWSNDRVIAITAQEWADAIAPAVADRLQRQVAPKLAGWDAAEAAATGKSWSTTWGIPFLPFASQLTAAGPAGNDFCGNAGVSPSIEGMPPTASQATAGCSTSWTNPDGSSALAGLTLVGGACDTNATNVQCSFNRLWSLLGSATMTADAPRISSSFRGTLQASDVVVTGNYSSKTVTMAATSNPDRVRITVTATWPLPTPFDLFTPVSITVPHVADAAVLSDANVSWFLANSWNQYTYYAIAPGATLNASTACAAAGDPGCITVTGFASGTGNTNDKRLVLALMGPRAVTTAAGYAQTQPSSNPADYLESRSSATRFTAATVTTTYNDRLAACPFQFTLQSGATTSICN